MVEKRRETKATKRGYCEHSFHFALAINIMYPSLDNLTRPMYVVRHGTVLKMLQPRRSSAKSNYSSHKTRLRALMDSDCYKAREAE
jgi:DNA-binding GntR family transcriptional regulator